MVQPIQGTAATDANFKFNVPQKDGKKGAKSVNLTKHSPAYHRTQEKLAVVTDIGQYKTSDPKKYERMKNVYNNTAYEVLEDGSVKFNIKKEVSVKDFKEAYGISSGALQKHLSARHEKDIENGYVQITEAKIYIDSSVKTEKDFDDSRVPYGGGYIEDPQDKMVIEFTNHANEGSYLQYNDGYVDKIVSSLWRGTFPQAQYDGMSLYADEAIRVKGSYFK